MSWFNNWLPEWTSDWFGEEPPPPPLGPLVPLFKFGRPVIRNGAVVFVYEGQAQECVCCNLVGGTCEECIVGKDSLTVSFSNTPSGTGSCGYSPFFGEYWPEIAYSHDGSYLLDQKIVFSPTLVLFFKEFGTPEDPDDPGRLVAITQTPWQNFRMYLTGIIATVRCVDGDLRIEDVAATFQTFVSSVASDETRVFLGNSSVSFGSVTIDTVADCCASGQTDISPPWTVGCAPDETWPDAVIIEGEAYAIASLCGEFTNPDPPPEDPEPPEDPDPPPDPPDPPDPPFDPQGDCDALTECAEIPDLRLSFSDFANYVEAFTSHDMFGAGVSGNYNWLVENLNGITWMLPSTGGLDFTIELYPPSSSHATATADGILIRQDDINPGSAFDPDPGCEVFVQRIRVLMSCDEFNDGSQRVSITFVEFGFDIYTKSSGDPFSLFTSPTAVFQDGSTANIDHVMNGLALNCESGWTAALVEYDDNVIVPAIGTTHNFFVMAKVGT